MAQPLSTHKDPLHWGYRVIHPLLLVNILPARLGRENLSAKGFMRSRTRSVMWSFIEGILSCVNELLYYR